MLIFKQSESVSARRDVYIQMVDSVDNVTSKTGLTLTVKIVKAGGGSYSSSSGSSAEVSNGTYRISLASGDVDTLGQGMVMVTATGAANQYIPLQVVAFNPGDSAALGLSNLDAAISTVLNRIGAFTGSGINTILGFFKALLRKDAALTPSDVGGTFDNTNDSTEAIRDTLDGVKTDAHLAKAALVNKRVHTIDTGVDVVKDDDGTTTLKTLTPSETGGVVTVTPS